MKITYAIKYAENKLGDKWFRCKNCGFDEILLDHKYCANCGNKVEAFLEELIEI